MPVRFVPQVGPYDCGIAAVYMVAEALGISSARLTSIQPGALIARDRLSLLQLSAVATSVGLEARGWQATLDDLSDLNTPAILHVIPHHFVVFAACRRDGGATKVLLVDPACGHREISMAELTAQWSGKLLTLTLSGLSFGNSTPHQEP